MAKDSKRIKINFDSINKGKWEPIDMTKVYNDAKAVYDKQLIEYNEAVKAEGKRRSELACPTCKSTDKKRHVKYEGNGILGPGSRSWTTEDYYICQGCGVHFSDLNKKEITPPSGGLFNFNKH